jgi:DNA topoisomerase-3
MKTVIITEKPSVAQSYVQALKVSRSGKTDGYVEGHSSVLGKDLIITWAVGHLIGICQPEKQNEEWSGAWSKDKLPMIPKTFKYEPLASTAKQYKIIKEIYTRSDVNEIYYAGDSGREGIYIQALIRNQIFRKKPDKTEKVVWIDSFTDEAIINGIKDAKDYSHYQNMIDAGYARAISDWLVGMNLTEAFTLTSGKLINTGRVMTPTLAMVVERQKEIDEFVKTDYYGVMSGKNIFWKAVKGTRFFDSPLLYNENGFKKKSDADALIIELKNDKKLTVSDVKVQEKKEYAPYNFNLADLQNFCSKNYKISPAKTLEVAQSLYEKKLTTYPRTDSRFLSTAVAKEYEKKFGHKIPKRYVDDSKITDHYAIIPTFEKTSPSLTELEKKVYDAITKRYSDTMLPPYVYDSVSVTYNHKSGEQFFETYKNVKDYGFKTDEKKEEYRTPPKKGEVIDADFEIRNMETKPPAMYTTGTLIMAMEKAGKLIEDEELREQIKTCGIGTSATRAGIIEKLTAKDMISIDKGQKVSATDFGKKVISIIEKFDKELVSPVKTAELEQKLSDVAEGKMEKDSFVSEMNEYIRGTVSVILKENHAVIREGSGGKKDEREHQCPKCGEVLSHGKFGWYCGKKNAEGKSEFSFGTICGKEMSEKDLTDFLEKGKTKVCSFTSKNGKKFSARLINNSGNIEFEFEKSRGK